MNWPRIEDCRGQQEHSSLGVGFPLTRDHSVRFPDSAAFVAGSFQTSLATFAESFLRAQVVALCVCLSVSSGVHGLD
jgi:hypothetical protein